MEPKEKYFPLLSSLSERFWQSGKGPIKTPREYNLRDGMNLLESSLGLHFMHYCPDWDYMYIHEYMEETQACAVYSREYKGPVYTYA